MKKISVRVIDSTHAITPYIDDSLVDSKVFEDETSAFVHISQYRPEVIILDYNIRGNETEEYIALLNRASPNSKIVVIADRLTEQVVMGFFLAGARGYVPVPEIEKYINRCIQVVANDEAWITRKMVVQLLEKLRHQEGLQKNLSKKDIF